MQVPPIAHLAAALVEVPAGFALDRLADPAFVGGWALGSMGLQPVGDGVFLGRSMFDGTEAHVEIRPRPEIGLVDYAVGTAESRSPRIFIRVTDGTVLGMTGAVCLVALHAVRVAGSTEARWQRTCVCHEAEILLIKAHLETARSETRNDGQP